MARNRNELTAKGVAAALTEPGRHSEGGGLYLVIGGEDGKGPGRCRWLYLFQWNGKRREMDLGGYPAEPRRRLPGA